LFSLTTNGYAKLFLSTDATSANKVCYYWYLWLIKFKSFFIN
jgi:hypothetical protein